MDLQLAVSVLTVSVLPVSWIRMCCVCCVVLPGFARATLLADGATSYTCLGHDSTSTCK